MSETDDMERLLGHADVFLPDGAEPRMALARTTDLGIGAHPDDLEFLMLAPIASCLADEQRWFTGVTCTDGARSARTAEFANVSDEQMVGLRRDEQRAAAEIGKYTAMIQLGHPSSSVRDELGFLALADELAQIIDLARPDNIYTHNLADKHATHVAVGAATLRAIRSLPMEVRPNRIVGVEGWRDLDWLPDQEKVFLDTSGLDDLAERLAACFASQIAGGKRYDLAEQGRRRANATMRDPNSVDLSESLSVAMDLTPLIRNDQLDPVDFVTAAIDRFRHDVDSALRRHALANP